jgi:F-type H+-transporting ATPase subunit gamma
MELIATARFRKALDRATEADAYTRKIAELVADLKSTSAEVIHPLLQEREPVKKSLVLVLSSNRGLAGGYNGNIFRLATRAIEDLSTESIPVHIEVAGKRGVNFLRFRRIDFQASYTHFEDRPQFREVEVLADKFIGMFLRGEVDKVQVVYTKFLTAAKQVATVETILPMTVDQLNALSAATRPGKGSAATATKSAPKGERSYEFLPDPASILEELVPASVKVRLFKCFLDSAVSEQIARMVAMRGATENADDMIKTLTRQYNRARQSQITRELSEIIGGAAALE